VNVGSGIPHLTVDFSVAFHGLYCKPFGYEYKPLLKVLTTCSEQSVDAASTGAWPFAATTLFEMGECCKEL
jgi:hypothetical protein